MVIYVLSHSKTPLFLKD